MATLRYTVIVEPEEGGGYHVFCPALPGCHSYGDTKEEALTNIREAIELYIEDMKATGDPIPTEDYTLYPIEIAA